MLKQLSSPSCENITKATMRLWLLYFFKRQRTTSDASCPGPSTSRYEASATCSECEHTGVTREFLLGESPWTSHSFTHMCLPVSLKKSAPQGELNFSFGAQNEDEQPIAASDDGLEPPDTEDSAEPSLAQSEADTEMAAVLALAAKSIRFQSAQGSMIGSWGLSVTYSHALPCFPEAHKQ